MSSFSLICAVNDEEVLNTNLMASPDIKEMHDIVLQANARSAAIALNEGIRKARGDILIFAHQDVFLPEGWLNTVNQAIHCLNRGSNWAVLGVLGISLHGRGCGYVYSTGLKRYVGSRMPEPVPVQSLDEMVLILNACKGIEFDEGLPGFHLYGTDLCLTARALDYPCYALEAFCIHNSNGQRTLPPSFWTASVYMRRKWARLLPVKTPCITLTRWGWPSLKDRLKTRLSLIPKPEDVGRRVRDPAALYKQLQLYNQTKTSL